MGDKMDNFMDKLAERYNAQEIIRANSQAEAAKMQDLQQQVEAYEAVLQEMRKLNYKNTELTEKMYSLVDESIEKVRSLQMEAVEGGTSTELATKEMSDAVMRALQEGLSNMDNTVAKAMSESLAIAVQSSTDEVKAATMSIQENMSSINAKIDSLAEAMAQPQNVQATESEELRTNMSELTSSMESVNAGIRTIKAANDETKSTLKTALDTGIYGLKQDNKEIVEFMQRMNNNIMAKNVDPDQERKEAEAKEKEEEEKRALEERFKIVEDFMHKESVKVYRNVQAVVNEKLDRQNDAVENRNKQVIAKIGQVKVIAIIAMLLSAANIVLTVLRILGII